MQPRRARLADGPAIARGRGHRANIEADDRAAVADIGVIGRGRVVREGKGDVHERRKIAGQQPWIADTHAGREIDQPVRLTDTRVLTHQNGARVSIVRQGHLVAAFRVHVPPVWA